MERRLDSIIGTGIDLVDLERFREVLARRGDAFLERVYTRRERERCLARSDPAPELAVRFAAKEATLKAIGTGWREGTRWVDIEVDNAPSGRPFLRLRGRVAEIARELGARRVTASLTHSRGVAAAHVYLLGDASRAPWVDTEEIIGDPAADVAADPDGPQRSGRVRN